MSNFLPSMFYFPTTFVILDDNETFLKYARELLRDISPCLTFEEPDDCLKYFEDKHESALKVHESVLPEKTELYASCAYKFDFSLINAYYEVYNQNRFRENTVLVVDFHMAKMNGIEVCEKLAHLPMKKILITADPKYGPVVDALNNRIIDKFIPKNDPNFDDNLQESILTMQRLYFHELSKGLIYPMMFDPLSVLGKANFYEFMNDFLMENNIQEFYLIDPAGSMLLLNKKGEISWLLLKSDEDMDAYIDLAADSDAPSDIQDGLVGRTLLPYFVSQKDIACVEGTTWQNYVYSATPLPGLKPFYYSHVKDKVILPLHQEDILMYRDYLKLPR